MAHVDETDEPQRLVQSLKQALLSLDNRAEHLAGAHLAMAIASLEQPTADTMGANSN